MSGQRHAPAALYLQERFPSTHWIGGWVGLRAGLDTEAGRQSFASAEDRTPLTEGQIIGLSENIHEMLRHGATEF
jgi:hypothetical protein